MGSRGELWKNKPATANALVKGGAIIGYEIVNGGSGYSSPPMVSVPGHPEAASKVELTFGKNLETNGAISAITISQPKAK